MSEARRLHLKTCTWFDDASYRKEIACIAPEELKSLIAQFTDYLPDSFWFFLGTEEYINSVPKDIQDNCTDGIYVCYKWTHYQGRARYCTREKNHIGPHVSGIYDPSNNGTIEDAVIWPNLD